MAFGIIFILCSNDSSILSEELLQPLPLLLHRHRRRNHGEYVTVFGSYWHFQFIHMPKNTYAQIVAWGIGNLGIPMTIVLCLYIGYHSTPRGFFFYDVEAYA